MTDENVKNQAISADELEDMKSFLEASVKEPPAEEIPENPFEAKQKLPRGHGALVNYFNPPIPQRKLNQRQKRKLKRQNNG